MVNFWTCMTCCWMHFQIASYDHFIISFSYNAIVSATKVLNAVKYNVQLVLGRSQRTQRSSTSQNRLKLQAVESVIDWKLKLHRTKWHVTFQICWDANWYLLIGQCRFQTKLHNSKTVYLLGCFLTLWQNRRFLFLTNRRFCIVLKSAVLSSFKNRVFCPVLKIVCFVLLKYGCFLAHP